MDLSARDVEHKQFHDAWRGYNQAEVDDFLDRVAESLDRLHRENTALNERTQELEQATATSKEREEMLTKTLVTAQKAAEDAIAKAKARAEQMVTDAEERARKSHEEADQRISAAEAEIRRKRLEAETEQRRRADEVERRHHARARELEASIQKLAAQETELKQRLRSFLEQQLRALDRLTERPPQAPGRPGEVRARPAGPPARGPEAAGQQPATQPQPAVGRPQGASDQERQDTAPDQPTQMAGSDDDHEGAGHRRTVRSLFWRDE